MEEKDRFETKKKNINELIIDTIKHGCGKLISDLNFEKWIIIEEKELKKIKILEIIEIVKRLVFTNVVYDLQLK